MIGCVIAKPDSSHKIHYDNHGIQVENVYLIIRDSSVLVEAQDAIIAETEEELIAILKQKYPSRPLHTRVVKDKQTLNTIKIFNKELFTGTNWADLIEGIGLADVVVNGQSQAYVRDNLYLKDEPLAIHKGITYTIYPNNILYNKRDNTFKYDEEKCSQILKTKKASEKRVIKKSAAQQQERNVKYALRVLGYMDGFISKSTVVPYNTFLRCFNSIRGCDNNFEYMDTVNLTKVDLYLRDVINSFVLFSEYETKNLRYSYKDYYSNLESGIGNLENEWLEVGVPKITELNSYKCIYQLFKQELELCELVTAKLTSMYPNKNIYQFDSEEREIAVGACDLREGQQKVKEIIENCDAKV